MKMTQIADLEVNGIKIKADVTIEVQDDDIDPVGHFDNPADIASIQSGETFLAWVCVTATAYGLEGRDSLGAVVLSPNNAFNSAPFEADLKACLIDNSMVENALSELAANISKQAVELKDFVPKVQWVKESLVGVNASDFHIRSICIRNAIRRLETALTYGSDMASSVDVCINDAVALLKG